RFDLDRLLVSVDGLRKLALVHVNVSETGEGPGVVRSDLCSELILLLGFLVARLRCTARGVGPGDYGILFAGRCFLVGLYASAAGGGADVHCRILWGAENQGRAAADIAD